MMSLAPGDQLTYENFIYIAFTDTFDDEDTDDEKLSVGSVRPNLNWFLMFTKTPNRYSWRAKKGANGHNCGEWIIISD